MDELLYILLIYRNIICGWMKRRDASGDLYDKIIPTKLKVKFYKAVLRPAMM